MEKVKKWVKIWLFLLVMVVSSVYVRSVDQVYAATAIYDAEDLLKLSGSKGSFYLANDIDMQAYGDWKPIRFYGTLDGANHVIKNLHITGGSELKKGSSTAYCIGLFSYIDSAQVKNLGLKDLNVSVMVSDNKGTYIGGIAGVSQKSAKIDNCYVTGDIFVTNGMGCVGGLVGHMMSSEIARSYNKANITISSTGCYIEGGLVGLCDKSDGKIEYSYNLGKITWTEKNSKKPFVGGLVGAISQGRINYCYNAGNVECTVVLGDKSSEYKGGILFGRIKNGAIVTGLYANSDCGKILNADENTKDNVKKQCQLLNSKQMKQESSYSMWDFDSYWKMNASVNDGYPVIKLNNNGKKKVEQPYIVHEKDEDSKFIDIEWVFIRSRIEGTSIYYTLDGTIPSAQNGILFKTALWLRETTTINAVAVKKGYLDSEPITYTYTTNQKIPKRSEIKKSDYSKVKSYYQMLHECGYLKRSDIKRSDFKSYLSYAEALWDYGFLELADVLNKDIGEGDYYDYFMTMLFSTKEYKNGEIGQSIEPYLNHAAHIKKSDAKLTSKEKAERTLYISKASVDEATKLSILLGSAKKITLKVQGNEKQAKQLIEKLEKKIQHINKYSVRFQYHKGQKQGKYYLYTILENDVKLYKNTVIFMKKVVDYTRRYVKYIGTADFCDMSQAAQVCVIARAPAFVDYRVDPRTLPQDIRNPCNEFGMYYSKNNGTFKKYSDKPYLVMKHLCHATIGGDSLDYAHAEIIVWKQLGIQSYLNQFWTVVKVKNADGKTLYLPFYYDVTFEDNYDRYVKGLQSQGVPQEFVGEPKDLLEVAFIVK